ncbi:hypothetical protein CYMTET_28116 [Cymbomonas tetramitiformis]|uniref:peptidylprolyl isomerase n=1 Tax=Cymbomonas tetramitiformis TaxID=36881 RepID=A0AAE0FPZ7_9CHLO|nr:hypothetical protein CYMTET_28116 [Cymbomonas tetramitiformis]
MQLTSCGVTLTALLRRKTLVQPRRRDSSSRKTFCLRSTGDQSSVSESLEFQRKNIRHNLQGRRVAAVNVGLIFGSIDIGLNGRALANTYNIDEARARGEEAREERAEAETPGELVSMPSGLKYREINTGLKGPLVVPGSNVDIYYTVYRLSSGAYFKESSGGKPVYLFSLGFGNEGKDDVGKVYSFELGTKSAIPPPAAAVMVGMRQGGVRRVLVPPSLGWAFNGAALLQHPSPVPTSRLACLRARAQSARLGLDEVRATSSGEIREALGEPTTSCGKLAVRSSAECARAFSLSGGCCFLAAIVR